MGDADFIIDHMGGFNTKTGLPNFMNEPSSSTQIDHSEDPIETSEKPPRVLFDSELGLLFERGLGEIFLKREIITQEEFEEITKKISKNQFTKKDWVEIVQRCNPEEYSKIFGSSK